MKKILYIDMDGVIVDFESAFTHLDQDILKKYEKRKQNIPNIFSYMLPIEGAIEAYKILSENFDTYLLSTAPWKNPTAWSDKLEWVKKYLGKYANKRLILSHNKHLNHGDFLIDDRLWNGADRFKGEHIHFGTDEFPNWDVVLDYLIKKV